MPIPRPSAIARRLAAALWRSGADLRREAATRYELWRAREPTGDARASRRAVGAPAEAARLTPDAPAVATPWTDMACRHIDRHVAKVVAPTGPLDAADVRRLRTAIRRLRAIVDCMAHGGRRGDRRELDRALRRLMKRLGDVRDADVALAAIGTRRRHCGSDLELAALDELAAWHLARRERAFARAVRRLDGDAITEAMAAVRLFVATSITECDPEVSARRWWLATRTALDGAIAHAPNDGDLETLHALRIAARRVRHGLDYFGTAAPIEALALHADAVAVQRALGAHRDAALFHARLEARIDRATRRGHVALQRGLESSAIAARADRLAAFDRAGAAVAQLRGRLAAARSPMRSPPGRSGRA